MHLRRALLLFAIVLGLAALAAGVAQPRDDARRGDPSAVPAPTATPGARAPATPEVELSVAGTNRTRRLELGRSATVIVKVSEPGEVSIPGLGLVAPAEPLTPARFDVLAGRPGRHRVAFRPAGGGDPRTVGDLLVRSE